MAKKVIAAGGDFVRRNPSLFLGFFSIFILALAFSIPGLKEDVKTFVAVLSALALAIAYYLSLSNAQQATQRHREEIRRYLESVIPPGLVARPPIMEAKLVKEALYELVAWYFQRHLWGKIPVIENLDTTVEAKPLGEQDLGFLGIPSNIGGIEWRWFLISLDEKWQFRPVRMGDEPVSPIEVLENLLVATESGYLELLKLRPPRRYDYYYPIPRDVELNETVKEILMPLKYLSPSPRERSWTDKDWLSGAVYQIKKMEAVKGAKDAEEHGRAYLNLEEHLPYLTLKGSTAGSENNHLREQKLVEEFKKVVWVPTEARQVTFDSIVQIYKLSPRDDLEKVRISPGEDAYWDVRVRLNYFLPVFIKAGRDDILLNLEQYTYPFGKVGSLQRMAFKLVRSDGYQLGPSKRPAWQAPLCPIEMNRDPITETTRQGIRDAWQIIGKPGGGFFFPGDIVTFYWVRERDS